jgi:hypothetical protein
MAIISSDLKYKFSGGSSNSVPASSIGGAISSVDVTSSLFDNVTSGEATAGDINYRCVYVKNTHGTLTALSMKIWIQTNTPSTDTTVDIGLGAAAVNSTETAVANEATAPASVTFSAPSNEAGGLTIGDLAPGDYKAVWIKRTVTAGAAAYSDSFTLRIKCDTLP